MEKPTGLELQIISGTSITIGEGITVTLVNVKGKYANIVVNAPDSYVIKRKLLYDNYIHSNLIKESLGKPSRYRKEKTIRTGPEYIGFSYGSYGGYKMVNVPTYFLSHVLKNELSKDSTSEENRNRLDNIIFELERRKGQHLGGSTNKIH